MTINSRFLAGLLLLAAVPVPALWPGSAPSAHGQPGEETGWIAYPEHLPGAFTGGFGEPTCHSCHFDYEPNHPEGALHVEGFPDTYRPGARYPVTISLERERLGRGGFQLTVRYEDGRTAGTFHWEGERLQRTRDTPEETTYLQHSEYGSRPEEQGAIRWQFVWEAPERTDTPLLLHVAANAANGDASEFGDWIYLHEFHMDAVIK